MQESETIKMGSNKNKYRYMLLQNKSDIPRKGDYYIGNNPDNLSIEKEYMFLNTMYKKEEIVKFSYAFTESGS